MCKKGRIKEFIEAHIPLLCFFLFIILSSIILMVYQSNALKDMRQRNDRILAHYEQVLSIKHDSHNIDSIDLGLYIKEFKLSPAQSLAFQDYTRKVLESAVSQSQVDMEVNAIVEAKAETMYQETRDLLEMQFAKIQHETESLQIWCGILTIVFLIFSFYSLFKTDELVQQGRDGVKELASLQETGKKSIENLRQKGQEKIQAFEKESNEMLANMTLNKQDIEKDINKNKENAISSVEKKVNEANTLLDQKFVDLSEALARSIHEHDEKMSLEENEQILQMIKSLEVLSHRIEEIERQKGQNNG